ncbi:MAG: hypothetical protein R3Y15_05855 [Rikenellaceae bacterium]
MSKQLFSLLGLFLLVSCGGGSSSNYTSNQYLGEIPSVYMQGALEAEALQGKESLPEDYQKLEAKIAEDAQKAFEKVKGQQVFFSLADGTENPILEIESVVVESLTPHTGALALKVKVKALEDQQANLKNNIKFFIINQENKAMFSGTINPYVAQPVISNSQVPVGKQIKAGEYCSEDGTTFMLYCANYDFTGFKQIMFVPKG